MLRYVDGATAFNSDSPFRRQKKLTFPINSRMFRGIDGGDCSDCGLLGCDTMQYCRQIPTFRRNILPPLLRVEVCRVRFWLTYSISGHNDFVSRHSFVY
jgi:hypothetical protein